MKEFNSDSLAAAICQDLLRIRYAMPPSLPFKQEYSSLALRQIQEYISKDLHRQKPYQLQKSTIISELSQLSTIEPCLHTSQKLEYLHYKYVFAPFALFMFPS